MAVIVAEFLSVAVTVAATVAKHSPLPLCPAIESVSLNSSVAVARIKTVSVVTLT